VSIQSLTPQEAVAEGAWHSYWRQRSYWRQHSYHANDEKLMRGAPAPPASAPQVDLQAQLASVRPLLHSPRDQHRGETDSGQLDLLRLGHGAGIAGHHTDDIVTSRFTPSNASPRREVVL
jgi:hypothetical protein